MDTFGESVELIRIVFLFGALTSLIYKKQTGITPGGIIVPALLAVILDTRFDLFVLLTAVTAVTIGVYKLIFSSKAYSHRWAMIINIAISTLILFVLQYSASGLFPYNDVTAFGYIIPGLIATASYYQTPKLVAKATLSVTALVYVFGWTLYKTIPYSMSSSLTVHLGSFEPIVVANPEVAIPLSLISAGVSYKIFNARSGGYLIAPFVSALIATSVFQFYLFLLCTVIAYAVVRILLEYSLVVGLERFVLILFLCSAIVSAIDLFAISRDIPGYHTSPLIMIIAMSVWVNDLCLQPLKKSAGGLSVPLTSTLSLVKVVS